MVRVKVPISSSLDTKDDLHTRKGHAEQGNLSVSLIDDACNKTISLHLPRHYSREHQSERKRKIPHGHLPVIWPVALST
jgi:hypothetical protein